MGKVSTIRKARPSQLTLHETIGVAMAKRDELIQLYKSLPARINALQVEIDRMVAPMDYSVVTLTQRQREVLELVRCNMSNKQIGAHLSISERTAKYHVSELLKKFKQTTRRGLLR